MSFLGSIFKRKPGGTAVGNLIRGAVKNVPVVGSFLGNGSMMITPEDADKRDLSDADYQAKYGVAKDGKAVSIIPSLGQNLGALLGGGLPAVGSLSQNGLVNTGTNNLGANIMAGANQAPTNMLKKYGGYIAGGVLLIVLVVVLIFKRKK